jgi:hypothetical protein
MSRVGTSILEATLAKKAAKRREWTASDVRALKTMAKQKTPASKIARTLKRTESATRQKAFALGISLSSRRTARKRPK